MKPPLLSSALIGQAPALAATQGALSAGPVTTATWGRPDSPSGGVITIVPHRSKYRCAPDSVGFTIDLSAATFDTPAPTGPTSYDRQFHELEYYWTFGDPGTWAAPEKTLVAWKNRDFAYGAFTRHMYRAPGTYTVSVMVVEPSSGKVATAQTSIEVVHPDIVFPGKRTICVNPVRDSDFSAAPVGAQKLNADEFVSGDAILVAAANTPTFAEKVRILFKSGWSGLVSANVNSLRSISLGVYGGGGRAEFLLDRTRFGNAGYGDNAFCCIYRASAPWGDYADFRCEKINFQGDFNEETDLVSSMAWAGAFVGLSPHRYMFHDCNFDGFSGSTVSVQPLQDSQTPNTDIHVVHLDDCSVSNFGGQYPLFGGGQSEQVGYPSWWVYTGLRIARSADALTEFDQGQRACVRQFRSDYVHLRGCDMHNSDGVQSIGRFVDADGEGNTKFNAHTNAMESVGVSTVVFGGEVGSRPAPYAGLACMLNGLFDSNIVIGGWRTKTLIECQAGGMTFRNNLMVIPKTPFYTNPFQAIISIENRGNNANIASFPTRIYNNTFINLRTTGGVDATVGGPRIIWAQADTTTTTIAALNVTETNNVVHQPNLDTPDFAFAPLSKSVMLASRNEGFRPTFEEINHTLVSAVPPGGTVAIQYIGPTAGYLPESDTSHKVYRPNADEYTHIKVFGPTSVTLTNTGTTTWKAGWVVYMALVRAPGYYLPKDTSYASGNIFSFAPLKGSAALGAALSEPSSERDILGQFRPAYPSMGAWEMP